MFIRIFMVIHYSSLSVAMATNQSNLHKSFMLGGRLLDKQFQKSYVKTSTIRQQSKLILLKSMETLSCHSNQSAYATAIKKIFL